MRVHQNHSKNIRERCVLVVVNCTLRFRLKVSFEMEISEIIMETFTLGTAIGLNTTHNASLYASVNSSCAQTPPPPSPATAGHFPALLVPGWGICKCCAAQGPGICQPLGQSRGIDMQAVSYQNITTHRGFHWERKRIGSSVKDRKKLKKVVKACSWFYVWISSLLIKPEL